MSSQNLHDLLNPMSLRNSILLFLEQLKRHASHKRAPKGIQGWWTVTNQADERSTERIFLTFGGFIAWFAYQVTRQAVRSTRHFRGRAECKPLIPKLETEPSACEILALQLNKHVDDRLRFNIMRFSNKLKPKPKDVTPYIQNNTHCEMANDADAFPPLDFSTLNISSVPQLEVPRQPTWEPDYLDIPEWNPEGEQAVKKNASLSAVTTLFPSHFSDAIVRNPGEAENSTVASISMSLPTTLPKENAGVSMTVEISCEKASKICQILFDAHLGTKAGVWYICLPGGAELVPNPKLTLENCNRTAIASMFGPEITNAICKSPMYVEEDRLRLFRTKCVSATISREAKDSVFIDLAQGLWEGTEISEKLFLRPLNCSIPE
ncbi:hypothetical protein F4810DRAFT_690916 [Camillea tinctor]|nr:hypothetical protein F4810DRAFT_690916 [Camillea tinctor]